jgi:glutamate dehydrogenase (NADP+)
MEILHSPDLSYEEFMKEVKKRNPHQPEFHQAVEEWSESVIPFVGKNPEYIKDNLLQRITEPDRILSFRVTWRNDKGEVKVNRGYRVQFNQALGPYKGGLRFHPSVDISILKFLAFEQTFKNSLTGLSLGAGKGGSDFDPKGKSDAEIMRFCQSFMLELFRLVGPEQDVPAGDIGVGGREIGYLYGMYKKLHQRHNGVLTGKSLNFGGSLIRTEATGYGTVYFLKDMLSQVGKDVEGHKISISGSGNVAQYAFEKSLQLGGKVITLSDSSGTVYCNEGMNEEHLEFLKILKNERRGRIKEMADEFGFVYLDGEKPWNIPTEIALPCATQNEIIKKDARDLAGNGCIAVAEGANMPTTMEGITVFHEKGVLFAPGKAANAGGVATSGLEMAQNSQMLQWTKEEVDHRLHQIMHNIHEICVEYGKGENGHVDYVKGANIGGFVRVAKAMIGQGVL